MYDLAHVCRSCQTVTIFAAEAPYPRRCGVCDRVVRDAPSTSTFVARPVDDDDDDFVLELGPASVAASPF